MDAQSLKDFIGPWFNAGVSFWCITLLVIASAAIAAFARNIVQSAYSLFFTLLGMAGYYVLLGADFVAVTQVVVYIGGVLVLLMFGVLLTNRNLEQLHQKERGIYLIAGAAAAFLFVFVLARIIFSANWGTISNADAVPTAKGIGEAFLTTYVLPFEFSSITLLACLIGAAYMARRKEN
ncbi:NADH-quinone oxidoreductase subunit J [Candidatus Sumerlaeota bacterium]|nr:NADH-quinone oxidoreductase subunit J [Candidatus Sumerlaeota bacterium]MBI3735913.1 NADH-quinone oxidoreductase subunit J [Candidatus Sumerlaeota bacterium]